MKRKILIVFCSLLTLAFIFLAAFSEVVAVAFVYMGFSALGLICVSALTFGNWDMQ
jgi:hypothetical protein